MSTSHKTITSWGHSASLCHAAHRIMENIQIEPSGRRVTPVECFPHEDLHILRKAYQVWMTSNKTLNEDRGLVQEIIRAHETLETGEPIDFTELDNLKRRALERFRSLEFLHPMLDR